MSLPLQDRVAIVVGSSSGMGRATAVAYAAAGAKIVAAARTSEKLDELVAEIGPSAVSCPTDVQDMCQVEHLIRTTLDQFGRVDIVVYSTGTNIPNRSLKELTHETWELMIGTNLTGAFNCTSAVFRPAAGPPQAKNVAKSRPQMTISTARRRRKFL